MPSPALLVARNGYLYSQLCERIFYLPTEQGKHTLISLLLSPYSEYCHQTFPTDLYGFHHRSTSIQKLRFHSCYYQLRFYEGSSVSPMSKNIHCRRHSWNNTLACISPFWANRHHYLWLRTSIHLACLLSPWQGPRSRTSHEPHLSPPNWQSDRMNQSDIGRLSSYLLQNQPWNMSYSINWGWDCSQYSYAWTTSNVTFWGPVWIPTQANTYCFPTHQQSIHQPDLTTMTEITEKSTSIP